MIDYVCAWNFHKHSGQEVPKNVTQLVCKSERVNDLDVNYYGSSNENRLSGKPNGEEQFSKDFESVQIVKCTRKKVMTKYGVKTARKQESENVPGNL